MPEILYPGSGLSPTTPKSVMPFNNVHTIWDVLTGKQYKLPGQQGDWGDWSRNEESQPGSYKDEGDDYKRRERDLDIFRNLTNNSGDKEVWKLKVRGGYKTFPSLESAQQYRRKMEERGVLVKWISRVAQAEPEPNQVDEALEKTFVVKSQNFSTNTEETGSAFCVAPNYFLTCAHVVKNYNKNTESSLDFSEYEDMIRVLIKDGDQMVNAEVIAFDGAKDLALLKADINAKPFEFDQIVNVGDEIFAVGSPHGFENNTTFGYVSSLDREIYSHNGAPLYMFLDLAILPGNSGGPIINRHDGKVIGVITAIVGDNDNYGLSAGVFSIYAIEFCEKNGIQVAR